MKPNTLFSYLIGIALLFLSAQPASATTRTVTNLNDSGAGSLRQAIIDSASGDTIIFAVTGAINLTSGELQINHDLTITGQGNVSVNRSGTSFFRIFYFDNGTWTVSGLAINNGHDTAVGGGIYNGNGNLTVSDCTFSGNYANSGGGGISSNSDGISTNVRTTVRNCTFSANTSTFGGAIANGIGTLTVSNCTFTYNNSNHGTISNLALGAGTGNLMVNNCTFENNAADTGGAIDDGGPVTVTNCTFNNNDRGVMGDMPGAGGAISCGGGVVTNCTFYNNRAGEGGAIFSGGSLTVQSCTFSGNVGNLGNSICVSGSATVLHLGNTILQSSGANLFVDTGGTSVNSMGYNLSSDNGGGFLTGPADQINTDAQLDSNGLVDNGGPTKTIALIAGSPAIDRGNRFGLTTDQRGSSRPVDNPNVANATDGTDIGAYESPVDPVQGGTGFVVTTTNDHDDGVCGAADCTLREAVARANTVPGANSIIFAHTLSGSITLTMGELDVTGSLSITGIPIGTISGNGVSRVFNFTAGNSFLFGLTIRDGWNAGSSGGVTRAGGGIYNQAALTLSDCTFTNNFVQGGSNSDGAGGAGGSAYGGGIFNAGTLTLTRCTFYRDNSGNVAGGGAGSSSGVSGPGGAGGEGAGGAVFNGFGATLNINNCTFNGNSAAGGNGGDGPIRGGGNGGNGNGGAICNRGTMVVSAATINGNFGTGGLGGLGSHGSNGANGIGIGGVASSLGASSTVKNSISAGNGGNNGGGSDVDGTFTSNGYNLIGIGDFSTGFTATGDQVGTTAAPINPHLGPLQNNGGATLTMVPQANSSALDRGFAFGLTSDQRGRSRPFDDPAIPDAPGGDGSDIGAVEISSGIAPTTVVSRKVHGVGTFDIPLSSDTLGDECRSGGASGDYSLIFTFAAPVTFTSASVCNGIGMVSNASASGNQVTVNLTGVTPAEVLNVCLSNVNDGTTSGAVSVPFRVLVGDTTGNGSVNASDVSLTKLKSGLTVDAI